MTKMKSREYETKRSSNRDIAPRLSRAAAGGPNLFTCLSIIAVAESHCPRDRDMTPWRVPEMVEPLRQCWSWSVCCLNWCSLLPKKRSFLIPGCAAGPSFVMSSISTAADSARWDMVPHVDVTDIAEKPSMVRQVGDGG